MAVGTCAEWGCRRMISMSRLRGGNPTALAEPEVWAVEFKMCLDCKATVCDRCSRNRGGGWRRPRCPRCAGKMVNGRRRWERLFERPDPPEVRAYEEGVLRGKRGQWAEALESLDTALRLRPLFPAALLYRAAALRHLGRTDEAVSVLDELIRVDPGNVQAMFDKGTALSALGRLDEAIATYRTAIETEPAYASARVNLAILLLDKGEATEALRLCREAVRLFETRTHAEKASLLQYALGAEGAALLACGRPEEALERLDRAADEGLETPEIYRDRALALEALGRHEEAAQARRMAEDLANRE